jgi:hypothetical protein
MIGPDSCGVADDASDAMRRAGPGWSLSAASTTPAPGTSILVTTAIH